MMDRCLQTLCSLVLLSSLACSTAHMVQLARRNGALRQLMQTVPALLADDAPLVGITVVETALQFSAAVAAGAEHIEVQGHMDLTSLEPSGDTVLGTLPSTVKSIRVCSASRSTSVAVYSLSRVLTIHSLHCAHR